MIRPPAERDAIQYEHNLLVARFQRITQSLDALNAISPGLNEPDPGRSKTLLLVAQTHHRLRSSITPLKKHFDVTSPLSEIPYDRTKHFEDMMPHIRLLLSQTSSSTPIYSAAPGPLSALWQIGADAPSSCVALRKEAIELIQQHPRREGLFDGRLAGQIAKVVWDLEQDAARTELGRDAGRDDQDDLQVPEHLQIVFMDVEYPKDDGYKAKVVLANAAQIGRGEGTVVYLDYWMTDA